MPSTKEIRAKREELARKYWDLRVQADAVKKEFEALQDSCPHQNITEHFDGNKDWDECVDCGHSGHHMLRPGQAPVEMPERIRTRDPY